MTDHNPRYGDTCEACLHRGRTVAIPIAGAVDEGSLLAAYCCPTCGHLWTCAWGIQPGRVLPPLVTSGGRRELAALLRARFIPRRRGDAA